MSRSTVIVDVVSDVVCPWCYIGQKRLARAVEAVPDLAVSVRWRPYQLDPTIPKEGRDRRRYMIDKFGSEERIAEIHARIEELGRAEGIDFAFDRIKVAPNTLDAHRVIRWAGGAGEAVQDALVRRLFALNFEEGADVGDPEVLASAAGEAGLDAATVAAMLATDADKAEVEEEIATASRMGISGVPCFILDAKYALVGAQEADVLADALRKVAAERTGSPSVGA
ncbi:MAG: DsbA family oxidoreductase [Rhizobiales bacterium]|nr:DsbA family oxidoreductase [Hyphomicrobiales bacterium]